MELNKRTIVIIPSLIINKLNVIEIVRPENGKLGYKKNLSGTLQSSYLLRNSHFQTINISSNPEQVRAPSPEDMTRVGRYWVSMPAAQPVQH